MLAHTHTPAAILHTHTCPNLEQAATPRTVGGNTTDPWAVLGDPKTQKKKMENVLFKFLLSGKRDFCDHRQLTRITQDSRSLPAVGCHSICIHILSLSLVDTERHKGSVSERGRGRGRERERDRERALDIFYVNVYAISCMVLSIFTPRSPAIFIRNIIHVLYYTRVFCINIRRIHCV